MSFLHKITRILSHRLRPILLVLGLVVMTVVTLAILAPTAPAEASPQSIWGTAAPTSLTSFSSRSGVELGTRFTAKIEGRVTSMRFWKTASQTGPHQGKLWTSSGTLIAAATFSSKSGSGWQTARFSTPVVIAAGTSYVVSYFSATGSYAATHHASASSSKGLSVSSGSGVFRYGSSSRFPSSKAAHTRYLVDVVFMPGGTSTRSVHPSPSPTPNAGATPTETPSDDSTQIASPDASKPSGPASPAGFPSAGTTGVPAGTGLSAYSGSCTITAPNTVIMAKTVNCGTLEIRAKNVTISRSVINGTVYTDTDAGLGSFTISDSQVNVGSNPGTGIGDGNFTAVRVHVTGGNRSINCYLNCTVQSSYVHGQFTDATGTYHESGIRIGSGSVISGNTIACDAPDVPPDAGCSAALTGYGDFAIVQNDTIDGNYFVAGSGGYCSYGGSTSGKPYSSGVNHIRFTNNVWQRGASGKCGVWGPITSFDTSAPGNVWSNNSWNDRSPVPPSN